MAYLTLIQIRYYLLNVKQTDQTNTDSLLQAIQEVEEKYNCQVKETYIGEYTRSQETEHPVPKAVSQKQSKQNTKTKTKQI